MAMTFKLKNNENIFFQIIFIALIMIKSFAYYKFTTGTVSLFVLTGLTIVGIYICSSRKNKISKIGVGIDLIITIFMLINTMHFDHFGRYVSFYDTNKLAYAGPVLDVIWDLVKIKYIIFFGDIIFLFILKKRKKDIGNIFYIKHKAALSIISIVVVLAMQFMQLPKSRAELLHYHMYDLKTTFFQGETGKLNFDEIQSMQTSNGGNNLTGKLKGKNLINIQVESLSTFVVGLVYNGQEITPNINNLIKNNSIYFKNYYQMMDKGHTSDAEFVTNNSLYPALDGPMYKTYERNHYYGLPIVLSNQGYGAYVFHGYDKTFWNRNLAYPQQGYVKFFNNDDYNIEKQIGFGLTDKDFFEQNIDILKTLEKPYYAFLITLTSHVPFELPIEDQDIRLLAKHENTQLGKYLQAINYTDKAIGEFIEKLKENGLYDDAVISIYGDHYAIDGTDETNYEIMTEFLGKPYDMFEMNQVPLIIHSKELEAQINTAVGSPLDYMPTMLNLLGIKDEKAVMFGQDLLNTDMGYVALQGLYTRGSFVSNEVKYAASRNYDFYSGEAYDFKSGEKVEVELAKEGFEKAIKDAKNSDLILKNDLVNKVNENIAVTAEEIKYPEIIVGKIDEGNTIESRFIWENDKLYGFSDKSKIPFNEYNEWLNSNKEINVVINIDEGLGEMLDILVNVNDSLKQRYIPQINSEKQFEYIKDLGFKRIIMNLENTSYDKSIIEFITKNQIKAVRLNLDADKWEAELKDLNLAIYKNNAHTNF